MKKKVIGFAMLVLVCIASFALAQQETTPAPAAEQAAEAPVSDLTVARMVIAGSIENREPVDIITAAVPSTTEKVYCYLELKNVPEDMDISFAWSFGMNEMGTVTQHVRKSSRWRTWSSKNLGGLKGDWKVDVVDGSGAVLQSATFSVE